MASDAEAPFLNFFCQTPEQLLDQPPLGSSLQNFESSLYLIALDRYPHALTTCAFAVESGLKAAFKTGPTSRSTFQDLLARARTDSSAFARIPAAGLDELRTTRNRIAHFGFSPKDDDLAAELLLRIGFPAFLTLQLAFFGFDVSSSLLPELSSQLRLALEQFTPSGPSTHARNYFAAVGHQIRWGIRESLMSVSECQTVVNAETNGARFELVARRRTQIEEHFEPVAIFNCPICRGFETLVGQLDGAKLDDAEIAIVMAACANCDLLLPRGMSHLNTAICAAEIERNGTALLRDYGIRPG